jgi:Ala-tRNA(Pro) deacylase
MPIAENVQSYLLQHAIDYKMLAHPHSGSSHETADAAHVPEDHIAKAVVVKDESGYAMVVIPASNWVDMERLRKELNRDLHLATEEEIGQVFTDCEVGAVPPVGPAYGIETFLDQSIMSLADVYFEGGNHEELVHVGGDAFQALLSGARHGYFSESE